MALDADLIAYYDAEARAGTRTAHGDMRISLRHAFSKLLTSEHRRRLLDVGAGPGLDTVEFQTDGFDVIGLDLARGNIAAINDRGLRGVVGSLYQLPFPDATFDALWTMSTFVHVPHQLCDDAISEMLRVVARGGPVGIGTWGGRDYEGVPEFGEYRPYRFFSLASHERWREMLSRHGDVERFEVFPSTDPSGWEYQFAVIRHLS